MRNESWQSVADTLGFRDEESMIKHLYAVQLFSLNEMSDILGYSSWAIRRKLIIYHVPMRSRGGPACRLGRRRLKHLTDKELFEEKANGLAIKHNVHLSTVMAERRLRKKETTDVLLSDNAGEQLPSVWDAIKASHGAGAVSEVQGVLPPLPPEGGGGGDGDAG